jgi:hypothetical protein
MKKNSNFAGAAICVLLLALSACGRKNLVAAENTSATEKPNQSQTQAIALPDELKNGLVLHFTFDTAEAGDKVTDRSVHGNDGQAVGAQWTPTGHRGGGFQFGPVTNYIRVPNSDSLNPERVTLAVWVKTARKDQFWRRIFDKGHKLGYALTIAGEMYAPGCGGQAHAMFNSYSHSSFSGFPVSDGQWHHLAATYDGSEQILFVDGKPVGTPIRWKGSITANNDNLIIGVRMSEDWKTDAGTDHGMASFDGVLDDVMIYNRALLPAEIKTLFTAQGGVLAPQPTSTPSVAAPTKPDAAERLKQVKTLYDQGLINKEDYDKKVKEIMDSL